MDSIVSYPNRGHYGKSNWRGNCSGYLVRDMLQFYKPKVFVDSTLGGGTSADVVTELNQEGAGIEFFGLDLHNGFNLLKNSLSECIGGQRADYVFCHPPYSDLIVYSKEVWGNEAHPDDLSRCESYEDFLMKMTIAMRNIYDSLSANGHYSVLIGDIRHNGEYVSIQSDLLQLAPGKLDGIIVKAQHNCQSDRKNYSNRFIPITHEFLLNFRNHRIIFGMIDTTLEVSRKLEILSRANWSAVIHTALTKLGGEAPLQKIYKIIEEESPQTVKPRKNWQARVRGELQRHFQSLGNGVWAIG
ncbi:MAG TPA: hypothetical protein PKY82_02530 [Pyrinomonadaceae bacterium]|nr:hypothetical protein [Pyrinomonadaceae bacterium]